MTVKQSLIHLRCRFGIACLFEDLSDIRDPAQKPVDGLILLWSLKVSFSFA